MWGSLGLAYVVNIIGYNATLIVWIGLDEQCCYIH